MKILIGGGTGFIGRALSKYLTQKGYNITIVSRTPGRGRITWEDVNRNGLPDCDAVVNLAGEQLLNPLKRWNEAFKKEVFDSRIKTTSSLVEAITKSSNPPKVFVCSSAIGYYPTSETEEYSETYDGPPAKFADGLVPTWEKSAELPESHNHVRHVIIRIGIVLGNDGGALQSMKIPFNLGLGGIIGSGKQYLSWIHIDDIVGIFTHAIESTKANGILNGTSPQPVTNYDFTKAYGAALWRPTIFATPSFILNLVYGEERALMLLEGAKILPVRTEESGYRFKFEDINAAMRDLCS